jgi:hypothetical protein
MKRQLVLGLVIAVGGLSMARAAVQAPPAGPTPAALNATKIEKVKDNLYSITGSSVADRDAFSGGNTAVFITDAGVVIVDTKLPGLGAGHSRQDQNRYKQAHHHHHQYPHARRPHGQQ